MNETSSDTGSTEGSPATAHQHGRVATSDHLELVWNSWTPAAPKAVMVIIHGLAEHGGRYRDTAEFFSGKGLAVYTCDLRARVVDPSLLGVDASGQQGYLNFRRTSVFFIDTIVGDNFCLFL